MLFYILGRGIVQPAKPASAESASEKYTPFMFLKSAIPISKVMQTTAVMITGVGVGGCLSAVMVLILCVSSIGGALQRGR